MPRAEANVVIKRPVEEVFAFATNPENDPQWSTGILESKQTSEGPMGVGTTLEGLSHFVGRRIEWTSKVTEYERNRKIGYKVSLPPPISLEQSMIFEPVEAGTRVTVIAEGETGGFFRLAQPIVVRMYERQMEASLANLKDILEAEA